MIPHFPRNVLHSSGILFKRKIPATLYVNPPDNQRWVEVVTTTVVHHPTSGKKLRSIVTPNAVGLLAEQFSSIGFEVQCSLVFY